MAVGILRVQMSFNTVDNRKGSHYFLTAKAKQC